ncbi:MAG: carboxylating nicotinate-nucleotide diphosphorylase [Desulfotomaculum sp.]|nr:carboxylating nicotinate-nucleotide diphosphorylase [Desulfotomaculum sp.]
MNLNTLLLDELIQRCLIEDIGTGDITTNALVSPEAETTAVIQAKSSGVVAGLPVAAKVFKHLCPEIVFKAKVKDGSQVERQTTLAEVKGNTRAILAGERVALNFLQRLSGVATKTAVLVALVAMYPARITDTRKTTPGLRVLEKYAVRVGGGYNHRFGLYDAILIKDNHIKVAGGITQAIDLSRRNNPHAAKVEIEVEGLAGVEEALAANADIIMLDNMDTALMREAVDMVGGRALLEASGGVSEESILSIAKSGVDLISVGALTHSAVAMDISLNIKN